MTRRRDPLDVALQEGLAQVGTLETAGTLDADASEVLRRHLLAAWAGRRVSDLVADALSPDKLTRLLTEPGSTRRRL